MIVITIAILFNWQCNKCFWSNNDSRIYIYHSECILLHTKIGDLTHHGKSAFAIVDFNFKARVQLHDGLTEVDTIL